MKKLILSVFISFFMLLGCVAPSDGDVVALDGPMLESIARDGSLEFNGVVVNTGDRPVRSVYVVVILKDEKGKIIDAASVPVLGESAEAVMLPNDRIFFTILAKVDPSKIASKEVEIYSDGVLDPLQPSS
ncbi:MAG: FxLYD domain-containing protein [Deltaproteobacteria bacterium]